MTRCEPKTLVPPSSDESRERIAEEQLDDVEGRSNPFSPRDTTGDRLAGLGLTLPCDIRIEEVESSAPPASPSRNPEVSMRPTLPTREPSGEHQLERLMAQHCLRLVGDTRVARFGSNVAVVMPMGAFLVRRDVLLSATGNTAELDFETVVPAGLSTDGSWIRIREADQVVVEARATLTSFPIGLTQQVLVARESSILGFDEGLLRGSVLSDQLPDAGLVNLRGEGTVVLESPHEVSSLAVLPGRTTTVHSSRILGWWGSLRVEVGAYEDADEGLLAIRGQGAVLIDAGTQEMP